MALKQHVGFSIPRRNGISEAVLRHFASLGYRLTAESADYYLFERGSKLSAFWRFDIRSYSTKLVVRVGEETESTLWISCDFDVWAPATIITGGDVAVLEAEGRGLESRLRTVQGS